MTKKSQINRLFLLLAGALFIVIPIIMHVNAGVYAATDTVQKHCEAVDEDVAKDLAEHEKPENDVCTTTPTITPTPKPCEVVDEDVAQDLADHDADKGIVEHDLCTPTVTPTVTVTTSPTPTIITTTTTTPTTSPTPTEQGSGSVLGASTSVTTTTTPTVTPTQTSSSAFATTSGFSIGIIVLGGLAVLAGIVYMILSVLRKKNEK